MYKTHDTGMNLGETYILLIINLKQNIDIDIQNDVGLLKNLHRIELWFEWDQP